MNNEGNKLLYKDVEVLGIPGGPVVKTWCFHCPDLGFIPGWETKIPQASWPWPKKYGKKKKNLWRLGDLNESDGFGMLPRIFEKCQVPGGCRLWWEELGMRPGYLRLVGSKSWGPFIKSPQCLQEWLIVQSSIFSHTGTLIQPISHTYELEFLPVDWRSICPRHGILYHRRAEILPRRRALLSGSRWLQNPHGHWNTRRVQCHFGAFPKSHCHLLVQGKNSSLLGLP